MRTPLRMRSLRAAACLCGFAVFCSTPAVAKRTDAPSRASQLVPQRPPDSPVSLDKEREPFALRAAAAAETTVLGSWTFEGGPCSEEGWVSVDLTEQNVYFHVEDFADMGASYQGTVGVLAGTQSLWCGTRPDTLSAELCGYATLPGYGNSWNQAFCTTDCVATGPGAVISFDADWDTEFGYDATTLEVTNCTGAVSDENWATIAGGINDWDGNLDDFSIDGDTTITVAIPDALHGVGGANPLRVRLHFVSDGSWSDQDGLLDTDGAIAIDNLSLSTIPVETFEAEAVGAVATLSGNWSNCAPAGFGDYAGLHLGTVMFDRDPCASNTTCLWAFITGTTADYSCGGYPGVPAVPYGNDQDQFLANEIWSPFFPNAGTGSTYELAFDVYKDLPLDNLIFFVWHVRSNDGCPTGWRDMNFLFYSDDPVWARDVFDISTLVEPGATDLQVALGVVDRCPFWCGTFGTGNCHSNAPFFDNPEVRRIDHIGPAWLVRDLDLFQDNFPSDGTATGTVRADMPMNISNQYGSTVIDPGDSVVVTVSDPNNPLAEDSYTGDGPAVYAYVGVWPQGQPGKSGAALSSDASRWPVVDSLVHAGDMWYVVRLDTAFLAGGIPAPDRFCLDLNDDLFTPGDTICYAFGALSDTPGGNTATYYSRFTATTDDLAYALDNPMEFTCLPATTTLGGSGILYVDNFDGLGAQPFFDTAFDVLGIADQVDRYDVLAPTSSVDNGPASRVVDVFQQVIPIYRTIIWNAGDVDFNSLSDGGSKASGKQDDAGFLYDFIHNIPSPGGIYMSGDNLARRWDLLNGTSSSELRDQYVNFNFVNDDHIAAGLNVSPLVIGVDGGCFDHASGPDTLVAFGGCPGINDFDVLAATGLSVAEAVYDGGAGGAAILRQTTLNADSVSVGVVLSGFSFHEIRDADEGEVPARAEHLRDILECLGSMSPVPTAARPSAYRNSLAQNYPNPFNPSTTVEFTVREHAAVNLRVYNVAGQLVRTLVDDERVPGVVHRVDWDGRNAAGQSVASGVYFYKLQTKGYTNTRKMVLLK